jgi:predicted RNase H-like HicB family nuclease
LGILCGSSCITGFTQADTWQELIKNIYEAIECHLLAIEEENKKNIR